MKIINKISLFHRAKNHDLCFGIPDTDQELKKMFQLRHQVYVERKKYIKADLAQNGLEMDLFDKSGKTTYFIASYNDQLVGTIRVIKSKPLPLVKYYFDFEEEENLRKIAPEKKIEIGRFISLGKIEDGYLPRHLIPFGLFYAVNSWVQKNGLAVGYGAMKNYNLSKLEKIKFPLRRIKKYTTSHKVKANLDPVKDFYFGENAARPIYFLAEEVEAYLDKVFNHSLAFKNIGQAEYLFRGNSLMMITMMLEMLRPEKKGV